MKNQYAQNFKRSLLLGFALAVLVYFSVGLPRESRAETADTLSRLAIDLNAAAFFLSGPTGEWFALDIYKTHPPIAVASCFAAFLIFSAVVSLFSHIWARRLLIAIWLAVGLWFNITLYA